MIRCLVLDADPLDRTMLVDALKRHMDVRVESWESVSALILARWQSAPDIVFADVRSTESLSAVVTYPALSTCALIALSAVPGDAVRAFDLGATDFLLKPTSQRRLAIAIARVRAGAGTQPGAREANYSADVGTPLVVAHADTATGRLQEWIASDIEWVMSHAKGTRIYTKEGFVASSLSLARVQNSLDARLFLRTHRRALAKVTCMKSLRRDSSGFWQLELTSGALVPVGKRRTALVRAMLTVAAR